MFYTVEQFREDLAKEYLAEETKMYVEIAGGHIEIVGSHYEQNGGAIIFSIGPEAIHHVRERLGVYNNASHAPERRK